MLWLGPVGGTGLTGGAAGLSVTGLTGGVLAERVKVGVVGTIG